MCDVVGKESLSLSESFCLEEEEEEEAERRNISDYGAPAERGEGGRQNISLVSCVSRGSSSSPPRVCVRERCLGSMKRRRKDEGRVSFHASHVLASLYDDDIDVCDT